MENKDIAKEILDAIIENSLKRERRGITRHFHSEYGKPYFDISPAPKKPSKKTGKRAQLKEQAKAGDIFWVKNRYLGIPVEKKYRHTAAISHRLTFHFLLLHTSRSYPFPNHFLVEKYRNSKGKIKEHTRYYNVTPLVLPGVQRLDEYEGQLLPEDLLGIREALQLFLSKEAGGNKVADWITSSQKE